MRLGNVGGRHGSRQENRHRERRGAQPEPYLREALQEGRGDLEQIKVLLGHSSIQTSERYLGSEQDIAVAVNHAIGF